MPFCRAASVTEVRDGTTKMVRVEGRSVLLAHWRGRFYAFASRCPHQGNSLEGARLWQATLECPWHHFRYDLATGVNCYPANVYPSDLPQLAEQLDPLPTYPVQVRDGEVVVGLPDLEPARR